MLLHTAFIWSDYDTAPAMDTVVFGRICVLEITHLGPHRADLGESLAAMDS